MKIFWPFKLSFDGDILAFYGLATVLAIFFQNLGEILSQSLGHTNQVSQLSDYIECSCALELWS